MKPASKLEANARLYCSSKNITISMPLGEGTDGSVWKTSVHTAVKVSYNDDNHFRELACYERLQYYKMEKLNGFMIPGLIGFDDDLRVIEMKIVKPPFILDFGKAYLDSKPPYFHDAHVMRDWEEGEKERWEEKWPTVRKLVSALQSFGIFYMDLNQRNIVFPRGDA